MESLISPLRRRFRFRPCLLNLERRIAPATATLSSGVLTINFTASGTTSESITLTNDGTNITLTGNISGATVNPIGSVSKIVLQDTGGGTNQKAIFAGSKPYSLSGGLTVGGIETATFNDAVAVTGSNILSVTVTRTIAVNANLSTVDGDLWLSANQQAAASSGIFIGIDVNVATISSSTGGISLQGRGGSAGGGVNPVGVNLHGGAVVGSGTIGPVSIVGTGGAFFSNADGVRIGVDSISVTSTVTSGGGPVSVVGQAGNGGSASGNVGVVVSYGLVTAGGQGAVTVQGSGVGWEGVFVDGTITSNGGPVSVQGATTSTTYSGVALSIGVISSGASGPLTITTDSFNTFGPSGKIQAGASSNAQFTIAPRTAGTKINLGGADVLVGSPLTLGLTDAELDHAIAGTIQIGDSSSGPLTISSNITRTANTAINLKTGSTLDLKAGLDSAGGAITLTSSGAITQTAGVIQTTSTLTLQAPGQIATFNSSGNNAAQLVIPSSVTALVNGSFNSSGAVQVDGTLGGSGSVGTTTVTGTGRIAPGSSPGKLNSGNITFNSGSVFNVELNGSNAGTNYDQLAVAGTVNVGGATLQTSLAFAPYSNEVFKIIDNDDTDQVTGTLSGLVEGATLTIAGYSFSISYVGGDGNDVVLIAPTLPPAPFVTSMVLDEGTGNLSINGVDGTTQRSEVRRIVVTFSEAVAIQAGAFSLSRSNASLSPGTFGSVSLNPTQVGASVTITFTGTFADSTGSLVDGVYNFTIDASEVSGAGGQLNGSGSGAGTNYSVTGTTANKWFRFYGDQNGGGTVDQTDYLVFRNALANGPNSVFDYQNSGDVDQTDYLEFRNRLAGAP